jgi:hypothetical protein
MAAAIDAATPLIPNICRAGTTLVSKEMFVSLDVYHVNHGFKIGTVIYSSKDSYSNYRFLHANALVDPASVIIPPMPAVRLGSIAADSFIFDDTTTRFPGNKLHV